MADRILDEASRMLEPPPPWLAEYGGTPEAIDRFQSYVSNLTVAHVYDAWKESGTEPVPFSYWRWHSVAAPGHKQDSRDWLELHRSLRDFMERGGILVLIGPTRSGKTCFLERMAPLRIIDNSRSGSRRDAPIPPGDVPPGLFAIDETHAHDRRDVARVAADMRAENRGFAIVFQRPESFRDYEIGAHLALQGVQFLELVDHTLR
ncbi:hypothetical protein [Sphingobium sp.]|jgi:hypothetical protein|uniref:hypothetical protein n=1 Tax=Sphingobium sp. TaxID=1912891 RepID=UPI00257A7C07|nr:hypothetical protein [Sphingobium sp.]